MSRLLTTEFNSPLVDPQTGKVTKEWMRKLANAVVLDIQGNNALINQTLVVAGQSINMVRLTPSDDVDGVEIYGTNAANTAVNWQIKKNGVATLLGALLTGQSINLMRITPSDDVDGAVIFGTNAANNTTKWSIRKAGKALFTTLNLSTVPAFANNAAAITGGLVAGDLYRTGGDPDTVCVVH